MAGRCLSAVLLSCRRSVCETTKLHTFCKFRVKIGLENYRTGARLVHTSAVNDSLWEHYTQLRQAVEGTDKTDDT
jgi:hypothetical protein